MTVPRNVFGPIEKSVVRDWFDVWDSEAVTGIFEDSASEYTELKYLKRDFKLVEASLGYFEGD